MANYADDFESYGTGSTIPTGYTGRWNYSAGEWDRVSDTDIAVRQVETSLSRTAVSMNAVDSDGNRAEVEILARFKSTVGTGSDLRGGVVVRGSGSAGSETGYTCGIFANDLRIGRYKAGASLQNAITTSLGLSGSAVYYWIRFRVSGTGATVTLEAKIWADGSGEPGSWTLTTTDTSADRITAAGWCGMFGFADGTRHWRDLAVATNGDTASMSGGGGQTLSPSLFTNAEAFYSATVTAGAVALSPPLFTNSQTFYTHTLSQVGGAQTLSPSLFTNAQTFYAHTLSQVGGTQTLTPALFTNVPFSTRPALLMHMDGANGTSTLVDDSSYAASLTAISGSLTTSDKQFGTASFDMLRGVTINGDIERFKFSGDYTIDMWVKIPSWGNLALFTLTDSPGFAQYVFSINASGGLQLSSAYVSSSSSKTANGIVPTNDWTHVQIARSGTTSRIFLDGSVVSTFTENGDYSTGALAVARAQIGEYVSNEPFVGKMDEVRVLSGEAANTSSFTPETAAYSYTPTAFPTHTVTPGVVTLAPSLFTNTATFYSATVSQGGAPQTLTASRYDNAQTFYGSTVTVGTVTLLPGLFTNAQTFYSATLSGGIPLVRQKGLRKTRYVPGRVPTQQAELIRFLQSELERLNDALESPFTHQLLEKLNTEPGRKRDGYVAYADGTNWSPNGQGEGVYCYYAGTWNKLG